ncbi:hypothetical protein RhiirB3_449875 [Rhizophagus irregularis]|nr:hypothetical protein RhiirB3_449875 [Rhizophagus irregularis]
MTNVYTLKDINNKGHRLGSASKAEINDLCEKLLAKNSEYSEREEDIGNKISQLNASSTKVRSQLISERKSHSKSQRGFEAKYTAKIKSLKSNIKTLKREATLAQKVSSTDKQALHDSLKLELERANDDLNSKKHEIECMEKGIEATHEITNNEIVDLSNPPPTPMNNSLQKLPGWLSDDLRPFVYECGLEDKVMELDKSFARENILEALQELLPWDEMVSRSQTDILPDQSIHSQPANFENFISREGVAKQLGGAEVVPSPQVMPLAGSSRIAPAIPAVESSLMTYVILTLFLLTVIWIIGKKIWNSWKKINTEYSSNRNYFLSSPDISEAGLYNQRLEVRR